MAEDTQLTWPIVGGEYPFEAGSGLFARVTAIDGDVVHYVLARKDKVLSEGWKCELRSFRKCFCPEDQSPLPKLVEALTRAETLLVALQAFIADNCLEEHFVEYDDAHCDGSRLFDDANFAVTDIRAALKGVR